MKTGLFFLKKIVFSTLFSLLIFSLSAQEQKTGSLGLELLDEESLFIGGLSSTIMTQGNVEINFYSALFSNQIAVHESIVESPVRDRFRFTDFTTNADVYLGVSRTGRFDIGARIRYTRTRFDNAAQSSPFKVFKTYDSETENEQLDKTYSGVKEIGLRFRLIPFKEVPELSLNAGYSFSPLKLEEDQINLGADRNSFDLNLAYYVALNNNSYYYFIANGTAFTPSSINDEWFYNATGSFFIIQMLANRKITLYPGISYAIGFKPPFVREGRSSLIKTNQQVLGILGAQFQATSNLSFNISTALPLIVENSYKVIQPVRASYSFVSIGGRFLL